MIKNKKIILFILAVLFSPSLAFADSLQMPQSANDLAEISGISAKAYVVRNADTGEMLIYKNQDMQWTPASLTKLVTALVVLDTKTKLTKSIAITNFDQTLGACGAGGDCIKAKSGVSFTVDGLFHAALLPSANNAASALARSTGMSETQFVAKMNAKAAAIGATNSHFNEPTGMDPANTITAGDYTKIVEAAFANTYLKQVAQTSSFLLKSTNNSKYNQTIKNSDKLLASSDFKTIGAKTGYLNESMYNFATVVQIPNGPKLSVVVLGEVHLYTAFAEVKQLISLVQTANQLAGINPKLTATTAENPQLTGF